MPTKYVMPETETDAAMKFFFLFIFFEVGRGYLLLYFTLLREGSACLLLRYFLIQYYFSVEAFENQREYVNCKNC